jgi:hypothetical protein
VLRSLCAVGFLGIRVKVAATGSKPPSRGHPTRFFTLGDEGSEQWKAGVSLLPQCVSWCNFLSCFCLVHLLDLRVEFSHS